MREEASSVGFAGMKKTGGKRKISPGFDPKLPHFLRCSVAMEEEIFWEGEMRQEDMLEFWPGFEAMEGEGAMEFAGEMQVALEDVDLIRQIGVGHPAIQAGFAEGGGGILDQVAAEEFFPIGGALLLPPRVETKGGADSGELAGKRGDGLPVGLAGAVDDPSLDSSGLGAAEEGW